MCKSVCINNVNENCSNCGYCSRECVFNSKHKCSHCGACEEQFVPYKYTRETCARCHGTVALNGKEKRTAVFDFGLMKFADVVLCDKCFELRETKTIGFHCVNELDEVLSYSVRDEVFTDTNAEKHIIEKINDLIACLSYAYIVKQQGEPINITEAESKLVEIEMLLLSKEALAECREMFVFKTLDILSFYKKELNI